MEQEQEEEFRKHIDCLLDVRNHGLWDEDDEW